MPVVTVRPTGFHPNSGSTSFASGSVADIADGSDATWGRSTVNQTTWWYFNFTDMPSDFDYATSAVVKIRIKQAAAGDDNWTQFTYRLARYTGTGHSNITNPPTTPIDISGIGTTITEYTTTSNTWTQASSIGGVANTKANWDTFIFHVVPGYQSNNMGGDNNSFDLVDIWAEITYTPSATTHTGTVDLTLQLVAQDAAGTNTRPQDPTNFQAVQQLEDVLLTWDTSTLVGATHVDIFRRTGTDTTTPFDPLVADAIARIPVGVGEYLDTSVVPGDYVYQAFSLIESSG